MADRILTKGLKTGTGVGGVKYILRRGLISEVAETALIDDGQNAILTSQYEGITVYNDTSNWWIGT